MRTTLALFLALAAGCDRSTGAMSGSSASQTDYATAGGADGGGDAAVDTADGGGAALCCSVPRVLTGLEKYDPDYATPYHNVLVNGTPQQQADATCDQLSSWPMPMRPGSNPTQAQIDLYMSQFMSGPDIAIVLPCWDPAKPNSSYGRWQCGGDAGQAAGCMQDGRSCGVGSACWFDPGGTGGYGCTGTVVNCIYPWH